MKWVDGAPLVEVWGEREVPRPVGASWDRVVRAAAMPPIKVDLATDELVSQAAHFMPARRS